VPEATCASAGVALNKKAMSFIVESFVYYLPRLRMQP
jgi:hypothetical protein